MHCLIRKRWSTAHAPRAMPCSRAATGVKMQSDGQGTFLGLIAEQCAGHYLQYLVPRVHKREEKRVSKLSNCLKAVFKIQRSPDIFLCGSCGNTLLSCNIKLVLQKAGMYTGVRYSLIHSCWYYW